VFFILGVNVFHIYAFLHILTGYKASNMCILVTYHLHQRTFKKHGRSNGHLVSFTILQLIFFYFAQAVHNKLSSTSTG